MKIKRTKIILPAIAALTALGILSANSATVNAEEPAAAAITVEEQDLTEIPVNMLTITFEGNIYTVPEYTGLDSVWVTSTGNGTKYHKNSTCSKMDAPCQISTADAAAIGYEPCKKCYQ